MAGLGQQALAVGGLRVAGHGPLGCIGQRQRFGVHRLSGHCPALVQAVPRHGEAHCLNGSAQRCNSLLKNGFFCIFVVKGIFLFHFRVEYFLHIYGASNTGLHFFSAKQEALTI